MKSKENLSALTVFLLFLSGTSTTFAMLYYNDGEHHIIDSEINDAATIDYQIPNQDTVLEIIETGRINNIYAYGTSTFTLNKGQCGYIYLYDNSEAFIDGSHGRLALSGNSKMHIYNSSLASSLSVGDSSEVVVYGSDFTFNGQYYGYGTYTLSDLPSSTYGYTFAGSFENGGSFNYHLDLGENAKITLVPEPASLIMLGLGGFLIRRKK